MGLRRREKENQMLKLVHPGGFVELHRNPIMASEIMNKNPRHYVTRPDFFKFPSIVVNPNSILTPGNVFFIVPCHTIRHLSKSAINHTSQIIRSTSDQDRFQTYCFRKQCSISSVSSCVKLNQPRTLREGFSQKQRNRDDDQSRSFVPVCYSSDCNSSRDWGKERESIQRTSRRVHNSEQIPKLKPCLKKDKNSHNARSRNLRVSFACDDHGDANSSKFRTNCDY